MAETAPVTAEHEWFIGEKKTLEFVVRDQDGGLADITNWDLAYVLRPAAHSETIYISKSSVNNGGISKTDGPNGVCQVAIGPDDYAAVVGPGTFDHALSRVDGENDTILAYGPVVLQVAAVR